MRRAPNGAQGALPLASFAFLVACNAASAPTTTDTTVVRVPNLTSVTVSCDVDAAEWTFAATADAWTGNGQVVLSADGAYVEQHTLYSDSAAADGTSDELELTLTVVPDWRDVDEGSSTVFNCDAAELAGILTIDTRDGAEVADCVGFGFEPDRFDRWDLDVSCDEVL